MTAMIVGAGTDYAVFLISRYHEYLRSGVDSDEAVQKALASIGKVIAASAATVAVTFLGMIFTRLPAFTSVGPALAVSIAVAFFAAVTLLPAILVLAGRRGWVTPRAPLTEPTVAALGDPARPAAQVPSIRQPGRPSRAGLLRTDDAPDLQRPHAAARLGGEQPGLLRDGRPLLDECAAAGIHLHPVTARSAQFPVPGRYGADGAARSAAAERHRGARNHPPDGTADWIRPRSATRPVQVGTKLADASSQINSKTSDLDALSGGAQKLADSLAAVRDQIHTAASSMTAMTGTLTRCSSSSPARKPHRCSTPSGRMRTAPDRGQRRGQQCEGNARRAEQQPAVRRRPRLQRRPRHADTNSLPQAPAPPPRMCWPTWSS